MRLSKFGAAISTACVLAVAGTVLTAGEILSVSVTPNNLSIVQGEDGSFVASVDSIAGKVGARNPPNVSYCAEWTIHSDGTTSCDTVAVIALANKTRNYTQEPVTAADGYAKTVVVHVDGAAPCNATYVLDEEFSVLSGSGTNFGNDDLEVTRPVTVTVTCPVSLPAFAGCSHGYWKNHQSSWPSPYTLDTKLGTVFSLGGTVAASLADESFEDALKFKGGSTPTQKAEILLRNAVAAVLNSVHDGIYYQWSLSGVVDLVNDALASGDPAAMIALEAQLDAANHGSPFCNDVQ
jgi:hypothetical protein